MGAGLSVGHRASPSEQALSPCPAPSSTRPRPLPRWKDGAVPHCSRWPLVLQVVAAPADITGSMGATRTWALGPSGEGPRADPEPTAPAPRSVLHAPATRLGPLLRDRAGIWAQGSPDILQPKTGRRHLSFRETLSPRTRGSASWLWARPPGRRPPLSLWPPLSGAASGSLPEGPPGPDRVPTPRPSVQHPAQGLAGHRHQPGRHRGGQGAWGSGGQHGQGAGDRGRTAG